MCLIDWLLKQLLLGLGIIDGSRTGGQGMWYYVNTTAGLSLLVARIQGSSTADTLLVETKTKISSILFAQGFIKRGWLPGGFD